MDLSVILEDCCDYANPCDYKEDYDDLPDFPDEEPQRDGIFIVHSEFRSLIDSSGNEENGYEQRYYSIYDEDWSGQIVYNDKAKALKRLKELKHGRFKCFQNLDDAIDFATRGGMYYCDFKFPMVDKTFWKMPRSRDLVEFRRAIQSGDMRTVMVLIEENPRYLVGSGDTPTILQGGCRYNALHVAARARSAAACSYILSVTSDVAFAERLYGHNHSNHRRTDILLDLYLNMPDKGSHETPLHFASKLGAFDVVKVLISYRQCDKDVRNKDGLTALEVACSRFPNQLSIKNEITGALGRQFFVPLLRFKDNVMQPIVGAPCTSEDPPVWSADRLATPLEVKAVAGPMSEELALRFRKKWKTPPRSLQTIPNNRPHLSDPVKGFEKLGRKLAEEFQVGWKEYWDFLDSFVDLASREGLILLNDHLKNNYESLSDMNLFQRVYRLPFPIISQCFPVETCFGHENATSKEDLSPVDESSITSNSDPSTPHNISQKLSDNIDESISVNTEDLRFSFSPMDTEKYYEIFAKRIAYALMRTLQSETLFEISYFQKFLTGCSKDERFCNIDLAQSHYRMSVLIAKRILDEPESQCGVRLSLNCWIKSLGAKHLDDDPGILETEDLLKVAICLFQHVKETLCNQLECFKQGESHFSAKPCDCKIPSIKFKNGSYLSLSRRLSFSDGEDSSGSEESFHTARSGEEETEDDRNFQLATPSGVFLTGLSPTKIDEAVFEAIESVALSPSDYPFVCKWKASFEIYEKGMLQEIVE